MPTDWKARAEREAAAIIAEALPNQRLDGYPTLLALVAIGWLQGCSVGSHESLGRLEDVFEQMRSAL